MSVSLWKENQGIQNSTFEEEGRMGTNFKIIPYINLLFRVGVRMAAKGLFILKAQTVTG